MTEQRRELPWFAFFGAAIGVFLAVYWRALPYPPVFDDFSHVIENRAIRYLFHPRIFFESEATRSRPLPYVTFALSYWLKGLSMSWMRGTSLALHVANAALVGVFFQRWLSRSRGTISAGSAAAVAVFLLHPLATGSVIYLSARGALLVLFFTLLALLFYARDRQNSVSWLGFLFCALLAFFSRESAAALAPLILVVHWLSRRRHTELVPYLGPLVIAGLFALLLKSSYLGAAWKGFFSIEGDVDVRSAADYFRLSLALWPRIMTLALSPGALAIDHQVFLPGGWGDRLVIEGIALWLGFAVAVGLYLRTRNRWLFPVCWFFLSLLPTNSIFPLLDPLSERHLYFALPALAWLGGLAVESLARRHQALGGIVLAGVLCGGATITLTQVLTWRSASELWLTAHRQNRAKFRIAFNASTSLIEERGDRAGALRVLGETLSLLPPGAVRYEEQVEGVKVLSGALDTLALERGKISRQLWEELGLASGFWKELTLITLASGKVPFSQWQRHWEQALAAARADTPSPRAQDPLWVEHSFLLLRAEELAREGRRKEAAAQYEDVILSFSDTHFPFWIAREALADLYGKLGREEEAVKQYELVAYQYKVFKRFPAALQQKLYTLFRDRGDLLRASDAVGELVRVRTDDPELRRIYAKLLEQRGDRHAARQLGEADYYTRNAVSASDERESLRP